MHTRYYRTLTLNRKSVVVTHLHAVTVENLFSLNMVNNAQNASLITNVRNANMANIVEPVHIKLLQFDNKYVIMNT